MTLLPRSLFARTALLIAGTILVFGVIAWQAIVWTALVPTAEATASLLTGRAQEALAAYRNGAPLPEGARVEAEDPPLTKPRYAGLAMRTYMERIKSRLASNLAATDTYIGRYAGPSEIWLRTPQLRAAWLVLS